MADESDVGTPRVGEGVDEKLMRTDSIGPHGERSSGTAFTDKFLNDAAGDEKLLKRAAVKLVEHIFGTEIGKTRIRWSLRRGQIVAETTYNGLDQGPEEIVGQRAHSGFKRIDFLSDKAPVIGCDGVGPLAAVGEIAETASIGAQPRHTEIGRQGPVIEGRIVFEFHKIVYIRQG